MWVWSIYEPCSLNYGLDKICTKFSPTVKIDNILHESWTCSKCISCIVHVCIIIYTSPWRGVHYSRVTVCDYVYYPFLHFAGAVHIIIENIDSILPVPILSRYLLYRTYVECWSYSLVIIIILHSGSTTTRIASMVVSTQLQGPTGLFDTFVGDSIVINFVTDKVRNTYHYTHLLLSIFLTGEHCGWNICFLVGLFVTQGWASAVSASVISSSSYQRPLPCWFFFFAVVFWSLYCPRGRCGPCRKSPRGRCGPRRKTLGTDVAFTALEESAEYEHTRFYALCISLERSFVLLMQLSS